MLNFSLLSPSSTNLEPVVCVRLTGVHWDVQFFVFDHIQFPIMAQSRIWNNFLVNCGDSIRIHIWKEIILVVDEHVVNQVMTEVNNHLIFGVIWSQSSWND